MNESINRINVLLSSIRALWILSFGTWKMVDWPAAPRTHPSMWRSLEPCPSTAATIFFFCIWQIWSMDQPEPVATLRGGRSSIDCLDWHRRVESGTTRWFIVGFVHFSFFLICSSIHFISVQRMSEWRSVCLGHASGRSSDESTQTLQTCVWGLLSGLFTRRPFPRFWRLGWRSAGVVHQGEPLPPIIWIIRFFKFQIECSFQKWEALFQLNSKVTIRWKGLRWNREGTKLAIPNFSPEVKCDQCNSHSLV